MTDSDTASIAGRNSIPSARDPPQTGDTGTPAVSTTTMKAAPPPGPQASASTPTRSMEENWDPSPGATGNEPRPMVKRLMSNSPDEGGSNGEEVVLVGPESYSQDYGSIAIRVNIEEVLQPPNVVRDTHTTDDGVKRWIDKFRLGQYGDGRRFITVCFLELPKVHMDTVLEAIGNEEPPYHSDIKKFLLDKGKTTAYNIIKDLNYYYCDGMHRGHAIKTVKKTTTGPPVRNLMYPSAYLMFRLDDLLLGYLDMRQIGSGINKVDKQLVEMTMRDTLQNTISLIYDIKNMDATKVKEEAKKFPPESAALKAWNRYTSGTASSRNVSNLMTIASHLSVHEALEPRLSKQYCIAAYGIIHVCGGAAAVAKEKEFMAVDAQENEHLVDEAKEKKLSQAQIQEKERLLAEAREKRLPPARANEKELLDLVDDIKKMDALGARNLWIEQQSMVCQKWLIKTARYCLARSEKAGGKPSSAKSDFSRCAMAELIPKILKIFWNAIIIPVNEKRGQIKLDEFLLLTAVYTKKRSKAKAASDPDTIESYFNNWIADQHIKEWKGKDQNDWLGIFKRLVDKIRFAVKEFDDHSPEDLAQIQADKKAAAAKAEIKAENLRKRKAKALENTNKRSRIPKGKGKDDKGGTGDEGSGLRRSARSRSKATQAEVVHVDALEQVVPTFPPGTPELKGEAKMKNQNEYTTPFWRSTAMGETEPEDFILAKPWLKFGDLTECDPDSQALRDSNGFRITHTFDGGKGILFDLPKIRDGGWKDVKWGTVEQTDKGDYLWHYGTVNELGGLPANAEILPIRIFEDIQNNWVHLDYKFKLEDEPGLEALEYDFVRDPPIPEKRYIPACTPQKVLRCMGIRPPHRSFFHLDMDDIREIRSYLGAYFLRKHAPKMCKTAKCHSASGGFCAVENSEMYAENFINLFRSRRKLLDTRGYIVFENILNPAGFGSTAEIPGFESVSEKTNMDDDEDELQKKSIGEEWKAYTDYFESFVPTVDEYDEGLLPYPTFDLFSAVRDGKEHVYTIDSDGDKISLLKDSRLITKKGAVTDMFEEMEDKDLGKKLMMAKVKGDFINMQLLHWLRVEEPSFDASSPLEDNNSTAHASTELLIRRRSVRRIYCPDTGSRLLFNTSADGKEQIAHMDYVVPAGTPLDPCTGALREPPYFVETTSAQVTPLWILDNSHRYVAKSVEARTRIAKDAKLNLKFIPPWSIVIIRGDMDHGGGSGKMAAKFPGNGRCPRGHFYGGRIGIGLPDSINDKHAFAFSHDLNDTEILDRAILDQLIVHD